MLIDPVNNTGKAITSVTRAIFDPIEVPNDKIESCARPDLIATNASGKEVPIAIKKKLMVYSEIFKWCAILAEDSVNHDTDFISITDAPKTRERKKNKSITRLYLNIGVRIKLVYFTARFLCLSFLCLGLCSIL